MLRTDDGAVDKALSRTQGDNMQKYLNIDPMDGAAGLHEGAGLLGQLPGEDETPSMPMQSLPSAADSLHSAAFPPASHGTPYSTPGPALTGPTSGGYTPPLPMTSFAPAEPAVYAPPGAAEDLSTSNPLAPRYPLPVMPATAPSALPHSHSHSAASSSAASSKSKKAMKEPRSMRTST